MKKLTIDYLSAIDESDLDRHAKRMRSIIRSTRGTQKESAEIELCYVQREVDIRRKRRTMHEEYMAEISKKKYRYSKMRT